MKLSDLKEAEIPDTQDIADPNYKPSMETQSSLIQGSTIAPLLRRSVTKLASGAKLQRVEAMTIIQAFNELLKIEPNRIQQPLRALQKIAVRAKPQQ